MIVHYAWFRNATPKSPFTLLLPGHILERRREGQIPFNEDVDDLTVIAELSSRLDVKVGDVLQLSEHRPMTDDNARAYTAKIFGWRRLLAPVTQGKYEEVFDSHPYIIPIPIRTVDGFGKPITGIRKTKSDGIA